jgi:hypothetical protein
MFKGKRCLLHVYQQGLNTLGITLGHDSGFAQSGLLLGALVLQNVAFARFVSFDLTSTGFRETLGGATVSFHLRHS